MSPARRPVNVEGIESRAMVPRLDAHAAGVGALVTLALLGGGGAAARTGGLWLGVPSWPAALATLAAGGLLVARTRGGEALRPLWVLPLALLSGLALPGLAALSGPPLLALAAAGALGLWWRLPAPPARLLFPVVLVVYLVVATGVQRRVGAEGDEPHYLMVAASLLEDGDLELEADYAAGRYREFYRTRPTLEPHYRVRGREGRIYSLHAVGLSLMVLPAFALAGYPGASWFMALVGALLVVELRRLLRQASGDPALAERVSWLLALSPPLLYYAGLVFTEVPAALLVAFGLSRALEADRLRRRGLLALAAAMAFLPWLNVRYAPLAVLVLLLAAWLLRRAPLRLAQLCLPGVASALGLALYHQVLYGFADPRRVYGSRPELSLAALPEGVSGLLLDQEFGLLVYAPVFALALPGLWVLSRRRPSLGLAALGIAASALLTAGAWHMWRGGWNPPARFLVPVLPALALGVAAALRRGLGAGAALLAGWGLWLGLAGAADPSLVHRDRDGTAPLFRRVSGAEEWTRLLPAYVLAEPDRHRLAGIWALALVAAVAGWPADRRATLGWAGALAGLWAAAGAAGAASDGLTGGRDAVRLLGRPALAVPGWTLEEASARWTPADLGWGPLYEPHRFPGGAPLAARLWLPPWELELTLELGELPFERVPELRLEQPGAGPRAIAIAREAAGLRARLVVRAGREATLRLVGGDPLLVKGIRLRRSVDRTASGPIP
jgi:hypothetical protein